MLQVGPITTVRELIFVISRQAMKERERLNEGRTLTHSASLRVSARVFLPDPPNVIAVVLSIRPLPLPQHFKPRSLSVRLDCPYRMEP